MGKRSLLKILGIIFFLKEVKSLWNEYFILFASMKFSLMIFFLDSIGMSRGAVATNLLSELNPEVRGVPVDDSPETVLNNNPDFFDDFDLVIATEIGEKTLATLSKKLWNANIPMMIVKSYGLLSYIRLQV